MSITSFEIRRTIKSNVFFLIGGILAISLVLSSPIIHEYWSGAFAVQTFINDIRMLTMFSVPFLVACVFRESEGRLSNHVLYSQPVSLKKIALSKIFAIMLIYGAWTILWTLLFVLSPIVIGEAPYSLLVFMGGHLLVSLPTLVFMILFCGIVYVKNPNLIALYIITLFFIVLLGYVPPVLDISVKDKVFTAMFTAEYTNTTLLVVNRIVTTLIIMVLLFSLLRLYTKSLDRDKGRLLSGKMGLLIQSATKKLLGKHSVMIAPGILPIMGMIVILAVYALIAKDSISWSLVNYLMLLLPSLYIIPSIAEVYENKRAGYLFTSTTPKHSIMRQRFMYGTAVSFALISILFVLAYLRGLESELLRLITLLVPSLFIALTGLTVANLTKRRVFGYVVAIALWLVPLIGGPRLSEQIWFMAPYLPVSTYSIILWESLLAMGSIAASLYICNIFIVSRREINRKEAVISVLACVAAVGMLVVPFTNSDSRYYTKENGLLRTSFAGATVVYDARLPESLVLDTVQKLDFMARQLGPYFAELDTARSYAVVQAGSDDTGADLVYEYRYLMDFNPSKFMAERSDFLEITNSFLHRYNLLNKPEYFREGLANYLLFGIAASHLDEISTSEIRSQYYKDTLTPEYSAYYRQTIQAETYPSEVFASILMETEERHGVQSLREILTELSRLDDDVAVQKVADVFLFRTAEDAEIGERFTLLEQELKKLGGTEDGYD